MHACSRPVIAVIVLLFALISSPAMAHEGREAGDYVLVFGWRVEPAYVGVYNGPEIRITHHDTGEAVEGAEATLQLEVRFGDQSRRLRLRPVFGEPGHYTADLIPTRPGDYTFVLTGTLGETNIEEAFTSADGQFSTVEPQSDLLFPELPSADIESRLSALEAQIQSLLAELEALRGEG